MSVTFCNALLTKRGSKTKWLFEPDAKYGELVHITNKGTVYAVLSGHKYGKPFWIGRLQEDAWLTAGYTFTPEAT